MIYLVYITAYSTPKSGDVNHGNGTKIIAGPHLKKKNTLQTILTLIDKREKSPKFYGL